MNTCACGRVTADDECPPICNYTPKETEMNTMAYRTPADFMIHYFGHNWTLEHAEDMAAKMRGELRIFKRCERYVGQERLDAWADTEAQSRQIIKIVPVTTDFDALLAFLDAKVAEGYEQDTEDIA